MPFVEQLAQQSGAQAAGNFINEGMGMLFQPMKNREQLAQARKMQDLSLEGEMTRLQRNQTAALQMWKDTSYGPQMEQLKAAGLNPGLIYGMSGGGGQTAQVSPGATSGGGSQVGQRSGGGEGMGLMVGQMGLLQAQKENIEANTAKTKVETAKTEGVETTEAVGRIKGLDLDNKFKEGALQDRLDQINTEALHAITKLDREAEGLKLDRATRIQKADIIRAQAGGEILRNILTEAQTRATDQGTRESIQRIIQSKEQINNWAEQILQGWEGLNRMDKEMKIKQLEYEFKRDNPGVGNVIGGKLNAIMNAFESIPTITEAANKIPLQKKQ